MHEEKQAVLASADMSHVSPTAKEPSHSIQSLFFFLGYISRPPTHSVLSLVSFSTVLFPPRLRLQTDGMPARVKWPQVDEGDTGEERRHYLFWLQSGSRRACRLVGASAGHARVNGGSGVSSASLHPLLSPLFLPEEHLRRETLRN